MAVVNLDIVQLNPDWENKAPLCTRDLRIKKVVFTIICLLNLAGIAGLLTYITMNVSLPTIEGAYSLTPFIGGVIAALLLLKIPTFGINHLTYRNLTNLPLMISEIVALLFFGPTLIVKNCLDWNDYADPYEAKRIREDFDKKDFIDVMEKYHDRIGNLVKYGYLTHEQGARFRVIFERYKTDLKAYEYLLRENPEIKETKVLPEALKQNLNAGRLEWNPFNVALQLPNPQAVMPNIPWYNCFSCLK